MLLSHLKNLAEADIVGPIAAQHCFLWMRSVFLDCCTGKSAGFSPLRRRSSSKKDGAPRASEDPAEEWRGPAARRGAAGASGRRRAGRVAAPTSKRMGGDPRRAARGLLAARSVAILLAAAREALAKQAKAAQDARANLSSLGYLELKCLIEIYNKRQQRFDIYETDDHAMALVHKGILNVVGRSGSGVLVCEVNPAIESAVHVKVMHGLYVE